MSDGERPSQQSPSDGAAAGSGGAVNDTRGSISESTSLNSSGGNGYLASTSSSSAASSGSASQSTNKSALNTSDASTATAIIPASTVEKVDEEPCLIDDASIATTEKNEEKSNTMNSDSSTDTFHTPSASMQNLSGSSGNSKLNGSSHRRRSDTQGESQQRHNIEKFLEEEEAVNSDSGATGATPQPTTITLTMAELETSPSPTRSAGSAGGVEECLSVSSGVSPEDEIPNNAKELSYHHQREKRQKSQHHKRESSVGSQCSLSSNPENSQFKTADAHSSDSDASRNSGTTSGFVYDVTRLGAAGGSGSDGGVGRDEQDRRSLQSDHSEQLNTSVESVEFVTPGELSSILGKDGYGHSSRMSVTEISYSGSKPRGKKKMWYQQIFSTSYKTRSGDFKKIFKELPAKERLIVDYSCALQKEILLQGRMYVSQNFVSFYSNIFGWETQLSISFKEIESVTKEKTALIIPNAIQISTMSEKFFFSSFVTRDTTYVMLFKLWQSALLEHNMTKKDLWRLVHTCYGEELGVTSEDESEEMFCPPHVPTSTVTTIITSGADGVTKSISIDPDEKGYSSPGKIGPEITVNKCDDDDDGDPEHHHEDDGDDDEEPRIGSLEWCRLQTGSAFTISGLVCAGEIGPAIAVGLNLGSSIVTSNGIPISSDQLLIKDVIKGPIQIPVLPMTVEPSDSSDADDLEAELSKKIPGLPILLPGVTTEVIDASERLPPICPVDHTNGKEMMNAIIPCNIDQLFTMLFTNSPFYLDFQVKRKTTDITQSDWQLGEGSQKTRQLTFTVVTGQTIGPRQAQVTETQTLLPASRPGLLYVIQSESVNAGIPYADCFSVNCHYCLAKVSDTESNLVVVTKIHYKKSTWAKSFIERNSMNAMVDFFKCLEKAIKEECAKMSAGGVTPTSPIIVSGMPRRRHPRKKCRAPDIPSGSMMTRATVESNMVHPGTLERGGTLPRIGTDAMSETVMDGVESSFVMKVILVVLGCLLLLNGFLYFKLSSLERASNVSVLYPPMIHLTGEAPQTHQEWLMLLQNQESLHRSEVHSWHEVLVSAIKILHQAETDLENLKAHISTYGHESIAIMAKPPQSDPVSSTVNAFESSQSSPSISSNVIPEKSSDKEVDKNNNKAGNEASRTDDGVSERIK